MTNSNSHPQAEQFYIQAISSVAEKLPHVLKHGDSFAIIDLRGNMRPLGVQNHGLFRDGTRFLSRLTSRLAGEIPLLLSSEVSEDADFLSVDLTNPTLETEAGQVIPQDTIHLRQKILVWQNTLYLQLTLAHYGEQAVQLPLQLEFGADYVDIFEVRGLERQQHGQILPAQLDDGQVCLTYQGLDDIQRQTCLVFTPPPDQLDDDRAYFQVQLAPGQTSEIVLRVACRYTDEPAEGLAFDEAARRLHQTIADRQASACQVETSHAQFNDWLNASQRDLILLLTETSHGLYPYAGIPWFSTIFGRDGLITALQTVWCYPDVARGVLSTLAALQATKLKAEQDAEPGKILHEARRGELANTGEVPFRRYYGSIDSTPLFIVLAGHYFQRTGDRAFIEGLWPSIEAALGWIDTYGDIDGDGFVEYQRKTESGLTQQGWKDSHDSVFHADGTAAPMPIALCEVQGYVYEAKQLAADMAEALGKADFAQQLRAQAADLQRAFHDAFWLDDLATYALALDGDKRPCRVRSSNAGHCLYSGIATGEHAARITQQLLDKTFFTGWGIRTIASGQARYNPMSYHNGSIWPHDNALIAAGMAHYGDKEAASRVLAVLFETSQFLNLNRLPELLCGFERRHREGPTRYPVACLPQAWASASIFLMLQACLGLRVDGLRNRVYFDSPYLPPGIDTLHIQNLRLGEGQVSVALNRSGSDVYLSVTQRTGDVEVIVNK